VGLKAKIQKPRMELRIREVDKGAGRAPADVNLPLVEILLSLALHACKGMQPSLTHPTLKNIYASGKVTSDFNQSWKNSEVVSNLMLLDLFRQSEPCLTKLMIDVLSNGLISLQGLKQSLNHDVKFLNDKAWLFPSGGWFLGYLACIIFSRKGKHHEEASYCCNTCVCCGPYGSSRWDFWAFYLQILQ
jgi:hypothetical protein